MPADGEADTKAADTASDKDAKAENFPQMTDAQGRRLFAILKKADLLDDTDRHLLAGRILERSVSTFTDLNTAEATHLINMLGEIGPEATRGLVEQIKAEAL